MGGFCWPRPRLQGRRRCLVDLPLSPSLCLSLWLSLSLSLSSSLGYPRPRLQGSRPRRCLVSFTLSRSHSVFLSRPLSFALSLSLSFSRALSHSFFSERSFQSTPRGLPLHRRPYVGYPSLVLGAIASFLEPFYGHLLPKVDRLCSKLTFEIPPRRALRGVRVRPTRPGLTWERERKGESEEERERGRGRGQRERERERLVQHTPAPAANDGNAPNHSLTSCSFGTALLPSQYSRFDRLTGVCMSTFY